MSSKRSTSVLKSLEEKIQRFRDSEPVGPPKLRPTQHVKATWIRSAAAHLLEKPFHSNLGCIKGSTDDFAADNQLCYNPAGNHTNAAEFETSLRQGMLRYCKVPTLPCTSAATVYLPPILPGTSPSQLLSPPQSPRTVLQQKTSQLVEAGSMNANGNLFMEEVAAVATIAAIAGKSKVQLSKQEVRAPLELAEVILARQMGVDVADVARLMGTEHKLRSILADAQSDPVRTSRAADDGGDEGKLVQNSSSRMSLPELRSPGVSGTERSHSCVSPGGLRLMHMGGTRKTHEWLQEARQVNSGMKKVEKQLLPLETARKSWCYQKS